MILTSEQREYVAAYLIDRADQYDTWSPSWIGLADAARAVMAGEAEASAKCGELDDLLPCVRAWKKDQG